MRFSFSAWRRAGKDYPDRSSAPPYLALQLSDGPRGRIEGLPVEGNGQRFDAHLWGGANIRQWSELSE